jgi:chitinase
MQTLREVFDASGGGYGLTFTIPASYWYLKWFDVASMLQYADWTNLMSYDMHGTWDGPSDDIGAILGAHTNLIEIQGALNLLWRNPKIDPLQVVMGFAFYGRSFKMTDPACSIPGCPFSSGGTAGSCTDTSGILSWAGASLEKPSPSAESHILILFNDRNI